ncbi:MULTISPECIES: proline-rich domain-containing protein [Actinomadura]|uniref:Chromosome segregation ATPase n=1 Tax=Actinomadura yumaensis TaxID=111807 RepID=A0ABW2CKY0_9ACTN|nr:proline-rich domain-containing protein [Actinomadura sp. J1-007]
MPKSDERDNRGAEDHAATSEAAVPGGMEPQDDASATREGPAGDGPGGHGEAGAGSGGGTGAKGDPGTAVARMGEPVTVWPCANCGRPVPQPMGTVRAVRYCQDNDGACAREARDRRERGRDAPGLTGQVASTWEMVERLEKAADVLADSLTSELSVAGVERRVSEVRAEAARELASAQTERDASQRKAEEAWQEAATSRQRAETAEDEAARAREEAKLATAKRDAAQQAWEEAHQIAQQAVTAKLAAESERDRIAARETELLAALETARAELVGLHSKLAEAEGAAEAQRVEAAVAKQGAEDLRNAMRDTEAQRQRAMQAASKAEAERTTALRAQSEAEAEVVRANARADEATKERDAAQAQAQAAVAERDEMAAKVNDQSVQLRQLSQSVAEQQAALTALAEERDAARAEADRARRQIDHFTHNTLSSNIPPGGRMPGGGQGPAPGLPGGSLSSGPIPNGSLSDGAPLSAPIPGGPNTSGPIPNVPGPGSPIPPGPGTSGPIPSIPNAQGGPIPSGPMPPQNGSAQSGDHPMPGGPTGEHRPINGTDREDPLFTGP